MWTATTFSVAGGSIQKKSSNLKLVENRVRLYLCHGIACAGQYVFAQEQDLVCVPFYFIYLFSDQIRRYGPPLNLHCGTNLDNLFFRCCSIRCFEEYI